MSDTLKKRLTLALMILPPLLFLVYAVKSMSSIRALLSESSSFHMDYANNLIQDYLELEINLETARQRGCILATNEACGDQPLISLEPDGEAVGHLDPSDPNSPQVYLKQPELAAALPVFFSRNLGLSALFLERFHEPIYWFRILDTRGEIVYRSSQKPSPTPPGARNRAEYPMTRTLRGYKLDIVYNSFGAQQLYSVARNRMNFGLAFFLFLFALFSGFLVTRSIRQKLILAKQKTFFVSTVSHEFKTPLAIMKLASETLTAKRYKTEEDERRFHGMLTNEINRLDHLVHKILSFNKIEMSQIHYNMVEIDLRQVLAPSLEVFQARAASAKMKLKVDISEEPCIIFADGQLVRHAIDNILDNAFKYRGTSDEIELSCQNKEGGVVLVVRDHGVGIAPEEIAHITKSFYRVNDPVTQGIRGSGLGLAISTYLLDHSGAKMSIVSELRKGSAFTIKWKARPKRPDRKTA